MDFWGRCLDVRDVCMNFESWLKAGNLVTNQPNITKLCEINSLKMDRVLLWHVFRFD